MPAAAFACPKCNTVIAVKEGAPELMTTCPGCESRLDAFFFPAFYRPPEREVAAAPLADDAEASCFYHPQKQAVRVCDGCGRLICSLCSVDMGADHMCPACISAGRKKAKLATLESSRTRYDNIALALAVGSLFMSFLALVLSPAAIYIGIRYWNSPGGLQSRGRGRMVIAIVLAIFTLVLWGGIFGLAFYGAATANHPVHHHA